MTMLDYEKLIAPLAGASCGPDLRAEPEFRDIEDAPGDFANLKAPELRKTVKACKDFLERTKDQAPAIVALQAAVRYADFAEATVALQLLKGYAETFWDEFHPGPADEMLVGRINELTALTRPAAMILPLQRAGLARLPAPSTVEFTAQMIAQACAPTADWSDADETAMKAQMASGQLSAASARTLKPVREGGKSLRMLVRALSTEAREADTAAGIKGGDESDPEAARKLALMLREQVATATASLNEISDLLYGIAEVYLGKGGDSPSFGPVLSQIKAMVTETAVFLELFPESEGGPEPDQAEEGTEDGAPGGGGGSGPRKFVAGVPRTREDVLASFDMIARYYAEVEPTSPVPIIMRRVRAWVLMDFMQLMKEINPNGIAEARTLLASREE